MSEKIITFPVLQPINTASDGSVFSPSGAGGTSQTTFSPNFTGDLFTSRGRFGNGTSYVEISAVDMHSANYVSGTSGWKIFYNGDVEFNEGTFRGDVTVANINLTEGFIRYGKTSFTDSANAGYYISSEGAYFGSAADATILKYTQATGGLQVSGAITTGAGSDIKGTYVDALSVGKLTAGTITSKTIALALSAGTGDCAIVSSSLDMPSWTGSPAFGLGMDDSDSDLVKFFAGNYSTNKYIHYDGSNMIFAGKVVSVSGILCGEDIRKNNAVIMSAGDNLARFCLNASGVGVAQNFGLAGDISINKVATRFTLEDNIKVDSVKVHLSKVNLPTDNIVIGIQAGTSSAPDGTYISSGSKAGADITGSETEYEITFSDASLEKETYYWLVFQRDGATDNVNYYTIYGNKDISIILFGQNTYQYNGAAWVDVYDNDSVISTFYFNATPGKIYNASALNAVAKNLFIGFPISNFTEDQYAMISVMFQDEFTDLVAGNKYYLTDFPSHFDRAAGTLPWTNELQIGRAYSTTQMLIKQNI